MKVLLFGNINSHSNRCNKNFDFVVQIASFPDVELCVEEKFYADLRGVVCVPDGVKCFAKNDFDGDIAISVGGDGTFLNTASVVGRRNIPILGINMGRLGFLADVSVDEFPPIMECLKRGEYNIEARTIIEGRAMRDGEEVKMYALNEIAILKQDSLALVGVSAHINGEFLHTYIADGLIVSTPTGSTGYALSVGGPIMSPNAKNLIIAPIASHSLNVRPLIIPDDSVIDLEVSSRSGTFLMAVDGQSTPMPDDCRVQIRRADYSTKVIRLEKYSFLNSLKHKLMWGADARK